jgi:peptidyl-prolyl cis-trans isomerase B (cyclophilin B)
MIRLNTNKGSITIELDFEKAPQTAQNFEQYVSEGFYDGTLFHRVIPGFMIQGGGMEPGMQEKSTKAHIQNEATNGLSNERGSLAMARTNDPHSASSQFFINLSDNDFLNHKAQTPQGWGYCVFGRVTDGMDIVDAIATVSTGTVRFHQDVPTEDVFIEKAEVIE